MVNQLLYSEVDHFRVATDVDKLRQLPKYEQIREEINRRHMPLFGVTNWEQIRKLCAQIAVKEGADILLAIYYTVAAIKTMGLDGLANGLDLQVAVLRQIQPKKASSFDKIQGLYQWMMARIKVDIQSVSPSRQHLRELYRCDRAIHLIESKIQQLYPEKSIDLELLSFTIYGHIERLEQPPKSVVTDTDNEVIASKDRGFSILMLLVGLTLGAVGLKLIQSQFEPAKQINLTAQQQIFADTVQPKVVTVNDAELFRQSYQPQQLQQIEQEVSQAYSQQVKAIFERDVIKQYLYAYDLVDSLQALYPDSDPAIRLQQTRLQWQQQMQSEYEFLQQRFINARTKAANINDYMQTNNLTGLSDFSRGLENYAISLSPLVGRLNYAEQLIEQQQYEQAMQSLTVLEQKLKAVLYQKSELQKQLEQQQVVATN